MTKKIISEGKTSTEAIEKGLKQLNVSKDKVDIRILENEEKRSFFSILAPRVVKVEMTIKEEKKISKKVNELTDELILASRNLEGVKVILPNEVNVLDVARYQNLVATEDAIKSIEEVLS